ncbi:MAG: D-alanine--D-alanine ligase [Casimicrobiaceae bacterium]|nr:D-alanine--D-alanine ligase [Casimicrobiaceae bacterium]MCX8097533.1 D-alanine--D-alanine ligase [Casimicrobiaceae bacterium]MDW8312954.1 D-alanine--D-alanine ligase family protein [Burkholderiales bacterium]
MKKTRVLVLAGGQSEEHEVSIKSARNVLEALPRERFEVTTVVISREGRWLSGQEAERALERGSAPSGGGPVLACAAIAEGFDVVFPILHGPNGEDGTVQGMMKLAGIPCVGSGVLGSAVCMDKVMMKSVLASHGVPQVAWTLVTRHEYARAPEQVLARLESLAPVVFVKPANLGSSVGISRATNEVELRAALRLAFEHDRRVIVEAATRVKPRELEVGILGNDDPQASPVGELTYAAAFYDYETKYTPGLAEMHIPARVPEAIAERVRALALTAFRALDCAGLARVDFFYLEDTGELFLNEVNTIPGFTKTSMYPALWAAGGVSYTALVTRLIELALERG